MAQYVGFNKLKSQLGSRPGVTNPGGLAAFIADKEYGKKKVQTAAAKGESMRNMKPLKGK